ncbi:MAG: cysteine desulfurase [Lachnospiraceae bacterium]|nr:cysteine desulfurase [Lachnospiraceae bacterium]
MEAYLDNSATTRCLPSAADRMHKVLTEDYGNPSSMHLKGVEAEQYLKEARQTIAKSLKVEEKEIIFTSGGSESNNHALIGSAVANRRMGMHIISTPIEHPSVLNTLKFLEQWFDFEVTFLPVDQYGVVDLKALASEIRPDTVLVSIMHVNNEIGTIEPIAEAGSIIKTKNPGTIFHVDAVQSYGKIPIYPSRMHIDLLSVSGHKIHGPKGSGFLYKKDKIKAVPIIFGGGQEFGYRSGTENVPAIAGMGVAVSEITKEIEENAKSLYDLKKQFVEEVSAIDGVTINGPRDEKSGAPHIVSISVEDVKAEVLLHALEEKKVYCSAGSACSSNKPAVSNTLKAIGLSNRLLDSTVRFSFSVHTTKEEIHYAADCLKETIPTLRKYLKH